MEFPRFKNPLILAPMEEVSGLPFRLLCRRYGCSLASTEMVSSHGIARNNPSTLSLIQTCPEDSPIAIQLAGQLPETLLTAAQKTQKSFNIIDINMGCPSPNIIKQGAGSALLKRKAKIKEIIQLLVNNLEKPVTAKIRLGFSKIHVLEIAKVIEQAGASAITIHARTALQKSTGKAQWDLIKQVKQQSSVPIIGNGDVFTPEDAEKMLKIADYAMLGRAAIRNPGIFKECLDYLATGSYKQATPEEKIALFFQYHQLNKKYPYGKLKLLKQRAQDFTHGLKHSAELRNSISKAKTEDELLDIMEKYKSLIIK